jgi:hypothetical protein
VIKHAGEKSRLARGGTDVGRPDAGRCEKAAEPCGVRREEAKCLNGHHFGVCAM